MQLAGIGPQLLPKEALGSLVREVLRAMAPIEYQPSSKYHHGKNHLSLIPTFTSTYLEEAMLVDACGNGFVMALTLFIVIGPELKTSGTVEQRWSLTVDPI